MPQHGSFLDRATASPSFLAGVREGLSNPMVPPATAIAELEHYDVEVEVTIRVRVRESRQRLTRR